MTPWHLQRRPGAAIPALALVLATSLLAGCVSVADAPSGAAGVVLADPATAKPAPGREPRAALTTPAPRQAPSEQPAGTPAEARRSVPGGAPTIPAAASTAAGGSPRPSPPGAPARSAAVGARPSTSPAPSVVAPLTDATPFVATPPPSAPAASAAATAEPPATTPQPAVVPSGEVGPASGSPSPEPPSSPPHNGGGGHDPFIRGTTQRRLQAIVDRVTRKEGVAGVQVAVRLADGHTWLGQSGQAEYLPVRRPIEDDTVFSIASVSKTFIAALILQLAEEGKIDLDVPFGRYFRDAPRKDSATVRQLLSHTSGIYDYFANPRYLYRYSRAWLRTAPQPGLLSREHAWTYDEIMALVKHGYCKPGSCYHYSNTNYVILGRIAEAVGGAPLDRQLRQRFFRPLGLDDTYYQPADVPPTDAAHGYWPSGKAFVDHTRDDPLRPFTAAVTAAGAAGAIASTARDLSVWAAALYGGKVLSGHSLAEMTRILPAGAYGLGTDVAVFAGHRALGHRGGLRGFESSMWYFPDTGVSIALLSNQGNWFNTTRMGSTDVVLLKIVQAVMGRGHGSG